MAVIHGLDMYNICTPRKLIFYFLSHLMGYDRGNRFPFDFEPNGNGETICRSVRNKVTPNVREAGVSLHIRDKNERLP